MQRRSADDDLRVSRRKCAERHAYSAAMCYH